MGLKIVNSHFTNIKLSLKYSGRSWVNNEWAHLTCTVVILPI